MFIFGHKTVNAVHKYLQIYYNNVSYQLFSKMDCHLNNGLAWIGN